MLFHLLHDTKKLFEVSNNHSNFQGKMQEPNITKKSNISLVIFKTCVGFQNEVIVADIFSMSFNKGQQVSDC